MNLGYGDDDWIVRASDGKKTEYRCANKSTIVTYHWLATDCPDVRSLKEQTY